MFVYRRHPYKFIKLFTTFWLGTISFMPGKCNNNILTVGLFIGIANSNVNYNI